MQLQRPFWLPLLLVAYTSFKVNILHGRRSRPWVASQGSSRTSCASAGAVLPQQSDRRSGGSSKLGSALVAEDRAFCPTCAVRGGPQLRRAPGMRRLTPQRLRPSFDRLGSTGNLLLTKTSLCLLQCLCQRSTSACSRTGIRTRLKFT